MPLRIVLIDCENLTADRQMAVAFRWHDFDRIELFGRAAPIRRWTRALAHHAMVATGLYPVAEDAPSQAADDAIAARVGTWSVAQPDLVVVASNDNGFDALLARLHAAGIAAAQHRDPDPAEILRLVATHLATNGRAQAAAVGTITAERFGLSLKGRLDQLAAKAGLTLVRDGHGLWFKL
jgi:hypothetical protein